MSPSCVVHMPMWYFLRYLVSPTCCARPLLLVPHSLMGVHASSHSITGYLNLLVKWVDRNTVSVLPAVVEAVGIPILYAKLPAPCEAFPSYCQGD